MAGLANAVDSRQQNQDESRVLDNLNDNRREIHLGRQNKRESRLRRDYVGTCDSMKCRQPAVVGVGSRSR